VLGQLSLEELCHHHQFGWIQFLRVIMETEVIEGFIRLNDRPGIYVVPGPNSAGKSTLFRTTADILRPYADRVDIR
jgi:ABC-type cobalamin/Fe3+-siderophores transport system ATPase subunit